MKIQPLYDLQQEINRLFIAGSKFAKGDPRLQKHIPILNKLGEKAPVFAKLAKDIEELLVTDAQQSSEKLMAISTLLYSILYTQGEQTETGVEEKEQKPNILLNDINTEYSYLQLKSVMEALTVSNSGRLEVLRDAMERNVFNDSRTYQYLDFALADKYSELTDYVENVIIPKVGKPIVPFLLQSFQYEDKTENVRRLRLLYELDCPQVPEMIDKIFSESLPSLQAQAVHILSDNVKNEEFIIKLADDKNKQVREAVYKALAKLNTRTSLEKLTDLYIKNKSKGNQPLIVSALVSTKLPFFFQEVFNQVSKVFEEFITLDKTTDDKILVDKLERLSVNLDILENKDYPEVHDFLAKIVTDKKYNDLISSKKNLLENLAQSVSNSIITSLNSFDIANKLAFYEKNINQIPDSDWTSSLWNNYFYAAVESGYKKERVFDIFNSLLKKEIIRISALCTVYSNGRNHYYYSNKDLEIYADKIDLRWLDLFYDKFSGKIKWDYEHNQALQMINALEPKESKRFETLLLELTETLQPSAQIAPFKLIMKRELPNRFELIFSVIEKFPKNTRYYDLSDLKYAHFWKEFPKEYVAKFKKLQEKTKLDVYNEIADEIEKPDIG